MAAVEREVSALRQSVAISGSQLQIVRKNDAERQAMISGEPNIIGATNSQRPAKCQNLPRDRIIILVRTFDSRIRMDIKDDGPGLTDEGLKNFGTRRTQRSVNPLQGNEISLGLGSFIMRAIAERWRAQ